MSLCSLGGKEMKIYDLSLGVVLSTLLCTFVYALYVTYTSLMTEVFSLMYLWPVPVFCALAIIIIVAKRESS